MQNRVDVVRPANRQVIALAILWAAVPAVGAQVVTDQTNYNAGSDVRARLSPAAHATASIRYAGETQALASGLALEGSEYQPLWQIPWDARTGRYEIDLQPEGGKPISNAASFAV